MQKKTLGELAEYVGGKVVGDPNILIASAATLETAGTEDITFLANRKYIKQLESTKAAAVIVGNQMESACSLLVVDDPYYAFRQIVVLLHGHRKHNKVGISQQACIDANAVIGKDCDIHNYVTICSKAQIGDRCVIYPGVFIGPDTKVGNDCVLYPNVVVYNNCVIGNTVTIHANTTIAEDGFGYSTHKGEHYKIPHIGSVIIEDDVEIGSNSAIERGTLDDTIIGKGSKIGDSVVIGHGTSLGAHCLLVPQVGIAGSATLGHHCVIGGQVGIVGHIKIGNGVMVGAQAGIVNNVDDGKIIMGSPAIDAQIGKRAYSLIEYLPEMKKRIRKIEKQIGKEDTKA